MTGGLAGGPVPGGGLVAGGFAECPVPGGGLVARELAGGLVPGGGLAAGGLVGRFLPWSDIWTKAIHTIKSKMYIKTSIIRYKGKVVIEEITMHATHTLNLATAAKSDSLKLKCEPNAIDCYLTS